MMSARRRKGWMSAVAVLVILGIAGLAGLTACGDEASTTTTAGAWTETTAAPMTTTQWNSDESAEEYSTAPAYSSGRGDQAVTGMLTAAAVAGGQKIISDAQLEIEVEQGKFQTVFDQALLLADRYGGYLVGSSSYASGEEDSMKSGTVTIRVPSASFAQAMADAAKLGKLKNQNLSTQDVTEEYVDLEARIKNSEAYVNSMIVLLGKAKTVDEILQVQSVLTNAQAQLEELKGRLRYLSEHTSYSTISMTVYETGVEVAAATEWGVTAALKDAVHNLVKAFNAIMRGLGVLIPILIVLGIVAYIVYLIVRAITRRNRAREQARYQTRPEYGWQQPAPAPPAGVSGQQAGGMGSEAAQQAGQTAGGEPGEAGRQG